MLTEVSQPTSAALYACIHQGSQEQKRATLYHLFAFAIGCQELKQASLRGMKIDLERVQRPCSSTILAIADRVLHQLKPNAGEEETLRIVARGAKQLWKQMARSAQLTQAMQNPTSTTAADVSRLLSKGAEISPQYLWRLTLKAEEPLRTSLVKTLLGHKIYPDDINIGYMLTHWSPANARLLGECFALQLVMPPHLLTKALKYLFGADALPVLRGLRSKAEPDTSDLEFALRHRIEEECRALGGPRLSENDPLSADYEFFKRSVSVAKEAMRTMIDRGDLSGLATAYIGGAVLKADDISRALRTVGPHTPALVRFLLLAGAPLSKNHLIDLLNLDMLDKVRNADDARLKLVLQLICILRIFGADVAKDQHKAVSEAWTPEVSAAILDALTADVSGISSVVTDTYSEVSFKNVVKEYQARLPGVFEMVIRAGHIPTLELLGLFFEAPRVSFFEMLMKEAPLGGARNIHMEQVELAAATSTPEVVLAYVGLGATLTPRVLRLAFESMPADGFAKIVELYKPQNFSFEGQKTVTDWEIGNPLMWAVDEPTAESLAQLEAWLDAGYPLTPEIKEQALAATGPYATLQLKLLEENGL